MIGYYGYSNVKMSVNGAATIVDHTSVVIYT
jgi:hypothetical protein